MAANVKSDALLTIGGVGTLLGVLYGAHRLVTLLHSLFHPTSLISPTDIYIFIMLAFVIWYSKAMSTNNERKFDEKLNDMHTSITKEWTDAIKVQIDKMSLIIKSRDADIDDIKKGIDLLIKHALNEKI